MSADNLWALFFLLFLALPAAVVALGLAYACFKEGDPDCFIAAWGASAVAGAVTMIALFHWNG